MLSRRSGGVLLTSGDHDDKSTPYAKGPDEDFDAFRARTRARPRQAGAWRAGPPTGAAHAPGPWSNWQFRNWRRSA